MGWIKPGDYSRKNVDKAGKIVILKKKLEENSPEEISAFDTFNNWRASHAYPMHIIKKNLNKMSKDIDPNAICVQRLKRAKSIIIKLIRFPKMKLSRIQDIGGCRVVLSNVELARQLTEEYISKNKRHKRIKSREENYINTPKSDGYRSIHLVYGYHSINKVGKIFNGRLVEIQIRSQLQHIWATALETVDIFTHQEMKFGKGNHTWKYFFKLVSSAFAMMEQCPPVPETPTNKKELYSEIKRIARELNVIERMAAWRATVKHLGAKKNALFVLRLNISNNQISFTTFKNNKEGWMKANEEYQEEEKRYRDDKNCDVVLVGADNISDLTYGYRNYFADTDEFLKHLRIIINSQD
tara:strand:- start:851 stop:1912 length:1062 start_codon:yes stop_codon:yes gene_type:complete